MTYKCDACRMPFTGRPVRDAVRKTCLLCKRTELSLCQACFMELEPKWASETKALLEQTQSLLAEERPSLAVQVENFVRHICILCVSDSAKVGEFFTKKLHSPAEMPMPAEMAECYYICRAAKALYGRPQELVRNSEVGVHWRNRSTATRLAAEIEKRKERKDFGHSRNRSTGSSALEQQELAQACVKDIQRQWAQTALFAVRNSKGNKLDVRFILVQKDFEDDAKHRLTIDEERKLERELKEIKKLPKNSDRIIGFRTLFGKNMDREHQLKDEILGPVWCANAEVSDGFYSYGVTHDEAQFVESMRRQHRGECRVQLIYGAKATSEKREPSETCKVQAVADISRRSKNCGEAQASVAMKKGLAFVAALVKAEERVLFARGFLGGFLVAWFQFAKASQKRRVEASQKRRAAWQTFSWRYCEAIQRKTIEAARTEKDSKVEHRKVELDRTIKEANRQAALQALQEKVERRERYAARQQETRPETLKPKCKSDEETNGKPRKPRPHKIKAAKTEAKRAANERHEKIKASELARECTRSDDAQRNCFPPPDPPKKSRRERRKGVEQRKKPWEGPVLGAIKEEGS